MSACFCVLHRGGTKIIEMKWRNATDVVRDRDKRWTKGSRGKQMTPGDFFKYFVIFWIVSFVLLLGYRLLTRQIHIAGILTEDGETFSPSRLQLLLVTVSGLAAYATRSASAHAMVPIPTDLVALFALSHGAYIVCKPHRTLRR